MRRKLVKQAGQALTITLPIDWIRKNGLEPGEEIEIDTHEKDLVLSSGRKTKSGKVKIETTASPLRMRYIHINSAYARGIDEIDLQLDQEAYPDLNQELGYAVVKQKDSSYLIRDISGTSTENLDEIFKRVFQMILKFYDSAIEDIFGESKEDYDNVEKMDAEINKFSLFLQRSISKLSYPDPIIGKVLFAYSYSLEKIGDEIQRLWRTSLQNKIKKTPQLKKVILLSKQSLDKSFEIYYQSSDEKIKQAIVIRKKIRNIAFKLMNDSATSKLLMHAIKIAEDAYDLSHLSLMKKLNPKPY